ncbi:hypothetical protein [Salinarimonas rosea]|uniref:hypothetical protein n=1 Tax=Salinarimonas rosea TaxID=552063 RepID=UPI00040CE366|nr:hypothetical protein [Salinarimonas rosea]
MAVELVFWLAVLAVPLGTLAWSLWDHEIRGALVPWAEIDARAETLRAQHGPRALEIAAAKEAAAWARGDAREQGIWRRVRRRLARERRI